MTRCLLPVLPLAIAAATSPLAAQWQLVPALNPPATRLGYTLTPMPNGELLLFGGDAANPAATEYAWNGVGWRPVTTPVPRRSGHAAGVDGDGKVVIFGGFDAASTPLIDTWTFDGTTWTQVVTTNAPVNLVDMTIAHDPRGGGVVLVGSTFPSGVEAWRFFAGDWTQVSTVGLPANVANVYHDSARAELELLVVGGPGLQTYRLVGGAWELTAQQTVSTILGSSFVAFDSDRGRMFGLQFGLPTPWTIENDGLTISLLAGAVPPLGLTQRVAYDSTRHERLCLASTAPSLTMWRWAADPVPFATAHGAPCVSPAFQLALAAGDSPEPGATHRLSATGPGSALTLDVIGFSHTQNGGLPLPQPIPIGALGCQLRVEAVLLTFLGVSLPATHAITLPNTPSVLGARYDAQCLQLDASGVTDASNALEVQIGLPLAQRAVVETFANDAARDAAASSDAWGNGVVTPAQIGGDGRHGSFQASFGTPLGGGVFAWNLDSGIVIPASGTPSGQAFVVTDGRFFFTDFVVPAGVTVRFVGTVPPQIFVRGHCEIAGTIDCSAVDMPAAVPTTGPLAGQRVSQFNAKGTPPAVLTLGQPGGVGGAGGGNGGTGGREPNGLTGPVFVGGINVSDGQPGQDVRVLAGHAYAGLAAGTGGAGSPLTPATGLSTSATVPFITASIPYRRDFSRGGGGGGFVLGGASAALPTISPGTATQPAAGPAVSGGAAFALLPFPATPPPGYQSLTHFLVGGSGGGGGGAHNFSTSTLLENSSGQMFISAHGGSGGGGAIALRAGGDLTLLATGSVLVRGGRGVVITGDNLTSITSDVDFGASSPGGGGSGGSVLLQSARAVSVQGLVDAGGGGGSRTSNVSSTLAPTQINVVAQAGAGSDGFYRLESVLGATFTGTGVPAFDPVTQSGALVDADARSGSRSLWFLPPASALPFWLRYELVVDVGGQTLLFSDDPAVSSLAADDPAGPVQLRFQGARLDAGGVVIAGTIGPWRAQLAPSADSVNGDRATAVRFDLACNKAQGPVVVRELRLVWR